MNASHTHLPPTALLLRATIARQSGLAHAWVRLEDIAPAVAHRLTIGGLRIWLDALVRQGEIEPGPDCWRIRV